MFADLDKTLETLLRREFPAELAEQVTISFAPPDSEFPPQSVSLPAIDLFLYDIRENTELRSNAWYTERSKGKSTLERPPRRVDCSYLVTAWASTSVPNPMSEEHWLLGTVMQVLMRYENLPEDVLQGQLVGQSPEVPAVVLQPGHLQSLGEFWQAMGGKPKAAINYTVTISVQPFAPIEVPITTRRVIGQ